MTSFNCSKSYLLTVLIFLSFGSAFAISSDSSDDDANYEPDKDVFDQIINTLVPTLMVTLFDSSNPDYTGDKSTKLTWFRCKQIFDDFLLLLSLFVLPTIVFHKNNVSDWNTILFGGTSGLMFILQICIFIMMSKSPGERTIKKIKHAVTFFFTLSSIITDVCFIFYTIEISPRTSSFTNVFVYMHIVTIAMSVLVLLILFIKYIIKSNLRSFEKKDKGFVGKAFILCIDLAPFIWTPVTQMLNMSLLSGNNYYWTKSILALNLIFISRILNYVELYFKNDNFEKFGLISLSLSSLHKLRSDSSRQQSQSDSSQQLQQSQINT
jgi:hypothetical protein